MTKKWSSTRSDLLTTKRAASKRARTKTDIIMVTDSCGCVFCDLDIDADEAGYHKTKGGLVACLIHRSATP